MSLIVFGIFTAKNQGVLRHQYIMTSGKYKQRKRFVWFGFGFLSQKDLSKAKYYYCIFFFKETTVPSIAKDIKYNIEKNFL